MAVNTVIGHNLGFSKTNANFDDVAALTTATVQVITKYNGNQNLTWKKGRGINGVSAFENGVPLDIRLKVAVDLETQFATTLPDVSVQPVTATAVAWGQLHIATDQGNGTLKKVANVAGDPNDNAGGTVVGGLKKTTGNYVEHTLTTDLLQATGAILALVTNDNGIYDFGGTTNAFAGTYVYKPDVPTPAILKWYTGTNTPDGTAQSSIATNKVVRLEISGDDVLLKYDGSVVHTYAGVLSAIAAGEIIPVKGMFAGIQGNDRFLAVTTKFNA